MKIISTTPEITFDDILLLPRYSTYLPEDEDKNCDTQSKLTNNISLQVPIIASPMRGVTEYKMAITLGKLGGLGILHHFMPKSQQIDEIKKVKKAGVIAAAAVGEFDEETFQHCLKLEKAGADLISIEALHANNKVVLNFVKRLKKKLKKTEISVAHIVSGEAVSKLAEAGADSIRVGIGGGSHCTTRLATGFGRPQLSALADCYKIAKRYNIPLISDTGIKYPGDIAKAFAFGASSVMIGGLFTGTDQTPGEIVKRNGRYFKLSLGNCNISHETTIKTEIKYLAKKTKKFIKELIGIDSNSLNADIIFEEGVGGLIPYKGTTTSAFLNLKNGLVRSMNYMGAHSINDIQKKAQVVIVSHNTLQENKPRI